MPSASCEKWIDETCALYGWKAYRRWDKCIKDRLVIFVTYLLKIVAGGVSLNT